MSTQSLDEIVKEQAVQFADQIQQAAQFAAKEEEIRIAAERALAVIQRETGITLRGRHEHTIGTGRADSVYGCVIIEYKNHHDPSSRLSSKIDAAGNQKVIVQIKKRFADFKQEHNVPQNTLFGVGCDGNYFIFVRSIDGRWFIEDPVEVSKYSAERFLWALINMGTKGKAFSPEYLAGDFGSDSPLSHEGVRAIYDTICSTTSPKATVFFQQWKILFGEVCGFDVNTPSDKIKKLAEFYGIEEDAIKPAELLFSIHTYYSIFMKLLASEIVAFFHKLPTPLQKILKAPTSNKLKEEMEDLERGSIFQHLNITNFLEGDLFAWYPSAWNDSFDNIIRGMANKLDGYNPGTLSENPAGSRDLLKKLYQQLFPKSVRHDLGEYYTPDWLAEHVLNELGYDGDPDKRLLDPACGSGTFLVMTINKIRKWYDENRDRCGYDEGGLARKILKNVIGFDLNPLAVMAARTNYLIAIKDLVGRVDKVEIPIYLCDSIMTPSEYGGLDTWTADKRIKTKELKTSAAKFKIPLEIAQDRQSIAKYAELLESCIQNGYEPEEFIERCKNEGLSITAKDLHVELYEELVKLDKANKNSIWARIIKNAFAPLFIEKVDYVAGNPPWVNWESLPQDYRTSLIPLYEDFYGLFPIKGQQRRLGSAKIDIASLFVYACAYEYLKPMKKLGFVITQTVFKTKGSGQGFRKFTLPDNTYLRPISTDDMSDLQPFEGATNRTAVFICERAKEPFNYPVPYTHWQKMKKGQIDQSATLDEVQKKTRQMKLGAIPVDKDNITSPWLTAPKKALVGIKKVIGKSDYKAYEGVNTGGLNGCYWIRILKRLPNGDLLIDNLHDEGKKKVEHVPATIEPDFVYPLLRGRDVQRWKAEPSAYIVMVHDPIKRIGIPEAEMKSKYHKTYAYLKRFEKQLRQRASSSVRQLMKKGAFYSMFGVGPYTLAPWKVVWRDMGTDILPAVINEFHSSIVLPEHHVMFVGFSESSEAYFLAGVLSSAPSRGVVTAYTTLTGISTHILENISVPKFDSNDPFHLHLTDLSQRCHDAKARGDEKTVSMLEQEIDKAAAQLWDITDNELKDIQDALKEMQKPKTEKR
ncbi:MAG: N-6 DNA methylase [Halobacteriota archaeon]